MLAVCVSDYIVVTVVCLVVLIEHLEGNDPEYKYDEGYGQYEQKERIIISKEVFFKSDSCTAEACTCSHYHIN